MKAIGLIWALLLWACTYTLRPGRLAPSHLLGNGGVTGRGPSPALNIALGQPGRCAEVPTLLITINDDSGSMLGGSDSTGLRYEEAVLAFDKVARKCRCDRELVAVLHMNRPTSADLPPTPLNRHGKTTIASALAVPTDGDGASEMAATLRRAEQIAQAHPEHRTTLVAFSDYELVDDMAVLASAMADFPGDVHAVVMRSQPPHELLNVDRVTVTTVATGEQPGAVARLLFDTTTAHRPGRKVSASIRKAV